MYNRVVTMSKNMKRPAKKKYGCNSEYLKRKETKYRYKLCKVKSKQLDPNSNHKKICGKEKNEFKTAKTIYKTCLRQKKGK